jgi:hypothetical protein
MENPMRHLLSVCGLSLLALLANAPARPALAATESEDQAAKDTDFLFQIGMLEGHLIVGHELLQAKRPALALPHFGHPLTEIYDNISDELQQHKFPPFNQQLAQLEAAVTAAPDAPETEAKYQAMIATVHKAREITPASLRASLPEMIRICADTMDAASGDFGESLEQGKIAAVVEYHDSRGFLAFVVQELSRLSSAHPDPASQALLARFDAVVVKARAIVEPLLPDPTPRASLEEYRAIVAQAAAIANQ